MFTPKPAAVHRVRHDSLKTAGGVVTRKDIGCGIANCAVCAANGAAESATTRAASLDPAGVIMIPDANIVLHNMNVLEDARAQNMVFLGTVVSEVQRRNRGIYSRLQRLLADEGKRCYVFANERHEQTHCVQQRGEAPNDFNDRSMRVAAQWYARHAKSAFARQEWEPSVVLVTHDAALTEKVAVALEEARSKDGEDLKALRCVSLRVFIGETVAADSDLLEMTESVEPGGVRERALPPSLFQEYVPAEGVDAGLRSGAYFKGKLRVSETSCFFGEIRGKFDGHPFERILIPGRANMNRAIHEDVVVVELLPVERWRGRKGSEPLEPGTSEEEACMRGYSASGRVVAIHTLRRRPFCGSLVVGDMKECGSGTPGSVSVLFQPKDSRIPRIRVTTRHVDDLKDKRLSVVIDEWPLFSPFPVGHYVAVLGEIGDRDTEATVILLENDIPHYDFSEAVYDCLPKGQWAVTKDQEHLRLDLRDLCVVSVDPLGCRDIDDALHFRRLASGNVEVGVHIADVTHFLHENTPMDEEAGKRSTSVYLVDRRINMLPQLLTENLCSLVEGEDRYAFTIMWEFDEDLKVVRDWYGKTIIRSRGALYYGDAQRMIDDAGDESDIAVSLRGLMRLSKHFKTLREKDGALFLASQEFKFKVDNDHVSPTDMTVYQTFEANSMVEEWMLYANAAAAQRVYQCCPRWTLLRRHQRPGEGAFDTLNEALERKLGVKLDDTTSLTLNQSLDKCVDPSDGYFNTLIRILATRCLRQAQYFSSGEIPKDEFYHFGLAMPIYTHFTSPIRRYADVIVHRQLAAAIGLAGVSEGHMDSEKVESVAANINYRHEQAQRAGRDSQNLFTGFFLRSFEGGVVPDEPGYVVRLTETHVYVLVPKYGQESRIAKGDLVKVPELLDRVMVGIAVKREGDVLRTKLSFSLVGFMREGVEGGVLEAGDADALECPDAGGATTQLRDAGGPPAEKRARTEPAA